MDRLIYRKDFVRAAKSGWHASSPGLALQAYQREPGNGDATSARLGFTTSKKVGNAVRRNRARRRLRELARKHLFPKARSGFDYVLIGRSATVDRSFQDLEADLLAAIRKLDKRYGQ